MEPGPTESFPNISKICALVPNFHFLLNACPPDTFQRIFNELLNHLLLQISIEIV